MWLTSAISYVDSNWLPNAITQINAKHGKGHSWDTITITIREENSTNLEQVATYLKNSHAKFQADYIMDRLRKLNVNKPFFFFFSPQITCPICKSHSPSNAAPTKDCLWKSSKYHGPQSLPSQTKVIQFSSCSTGEGNSCMSKTSTHYDFHIFLVGARCNIFGLKNWWLNIVQSSCFRWNMHKKNS